MQVFCRCRSWRICFRFGLSALTLWLLLWWWNRTQPISQPTVEQESDEEAAFPIAYSISVYRDPEQLGRLLKAIYRPFNIYCIHVDLKSPANIFEFVGNLTRQYKNIILPKEFIKVVHSEFSVLKSELLCMEALYKDKRVNWKYLINLTGQEWPLKVNLELVRILKALRGANLIEKIPIITSRIPPSIGRPPHNIVLWKGAVHIVVVRDFVKFALYNRKALDLLEYLQKTIIPDEMYFSTLNHDYGLRAPGGYSGYHMRDPHFYPFLNRHKIWQTEGECHGKFLRGICIFSMKDVGPMISNDNVKLFANKFIMDMNGDVLDFMERWFRNRTSIVYANTNVNPFINLTYYSSLDVVNHHH